MRYCEECDSFGRKKVCKCGAITLTKRQIEKIIKNTEFVGGYDPRELDHYDDILAKLEDME